MKEFYYVEYRPNIEHIVVGFRAVEMAAQRHLITLLKVQGFEFMQPERQEADRQAKRIEAALARLIGNEVLAGNLVWNEPKTRLYLARKEV